MKIAVIGIGNLLMRDDGIGARIVEMMGIQNSQSNAELDDIGIEIAYCPGETDVEACLDAAEHATFVIIVDAAQLDLEPGTVHLLDLQEALLSLDIPAYQHQNSLLHAMKQNRWDCKGSLILIQIAERGLSFDFGLSKTLENRLPDIVKQVTNLIQTELQRYCKLVASVESVDRVNYMNGDFRVILS